ncbi:hypothetical protein OPT61_g687 [Boeremia exigua]|uniref:Uncharacterized protein n=1 Tax=Boeremia exigua TaxID=749465 RepID=A0ACC2ISY0_9PLEO|nr:hypothetical protein OPT61_g687 [Boeremia exigua]
MPAQRLQSDSGPKPDVFCQVNEATLFSTSELAGLSNHTKSLPQFYESQQASKFEEVPTRALSTQQHRSSNNISSQFKTRDYYGRISASVYATMVVTIFNFLVAHTISSILRGIFQLGDVFTLDIRANPTQGITVKISSYDAKALAVVLMSLHLALISGKLMDWTAKLFCRSDELPLWRCLQQVTGSERCWVWETLIVGLQFCESVPPVAKTASLLFFLLFF